MTKGRSDRYLSNVKRVALHVLFFVGVYVGCSVMTLLSFFPFIIMLAAMEREGGMEGGIPGAYGMTCFFYAVVIYPIYHIGLTIFFWRKQGGLDHRNSLYAMGILGLFLSILIFFTYIVTQLKV